MKYKNKRTIISRLFNRKSIKSKFLTIFFLFVLVPCLLLIVYTINIYSKYVVDNIVTAKYNTIHAINETIDTKLDQYSNLGKMIYYNDMVMDVMGKKDWDDGDEKIITGYLSSIVNAEPYIESAIIVKDNKIYSAGKKYQDIQPYIDEMSNKMNSENIAIKWLPSVKLYTNYGSLSCPSVCYRAINDKNGQIGSLLLFVSNRLYNRIFNTDFKYHQGELYIIDDDQVIVASNNEEAVSEVYNDIDKNMIVNNARGHFKDNRNVMMIYDKSHETDWYMINATHMNIVLRDNNRIILMVVILVLLGLSSITLMYVFMSSKLTKPLVILSKGINKVAKGDFSYRLIKGSDDELGELTNSYNYMIDKIELLLDQVRQEEELKNKEKMKLLSMQIGPHFIYNTLNSIKWMAVINKQDNIKKMTESLIKLLMNVTYDMDELITLEDEIELLECYTYIQKVRYSNFEMKCIIPDDLKKCKVNKMLLQPIVENSIIHGLVGKAGISEIEVVAEIEKENLIIMIKDNGKGFDTTSIDYKKNKKKGIGIGNIQERIKLNFGDDYSLSLESTINNGTTTTFTLPLIYDVLDKDALGE